MIMLLPRTSSSRMKRKYVLHYRSFSDTLQLQSEYTLICKVQCRAGEHLSGGTGLRTRERVHSYRQVTIVTDSRKDTTMTMTAQNTVTLVQTLYDLMNNHQSDPDWLDKSLTFFAEDCEVIDIPSGMTSRGPDGYKQLILFFEEGFPDSGIEVTNLLATEDQAVVEFIGRGANTGPLHMPTGDVPPTGRAVEMRFCDVYRVRNGKIVSYRSYYDVFGFLQQLGLIPSEE